MGAGWVAGVTRARALLSRCLGPAGARRLAASATLGEALRALTATPYRRYVAPDAALGEAQRAVAATLLWHLRVLAGWQPPEGVAAARLLAAGFEIANTADLVRSPGAFGDRPAAYRLGALATAWPRLSRSGSRAAVRAVLAASSWGDPGGESPAAIDVGMRLSAAEGIATRLPPAAHWAAGRAALLVARERFAAGRALTGPSAERAARLLGEEAVRALDIGTFRAALAPAAAWAVAGIEAPAGLWRAEFRWWTRVDADGARLVRSRGHGAGQLVGAVAILSADAWRVRGALELAARGGRPLEAFDALV